MIDYLYCVIFKLLKNVHPCPHKTFKEDKGVDVVESGEQLGVLVNALLTGDRCG